ncbi:MAG TPA: arsenate reductase ArsC [Prolixibacteraceae bacterium]|nr:arsenate reductase ArsC [Prolixibacteraceae bacterium]
MNNMQKVLFVCTRNSARSQMAEAFLNQLGNGRFIAESAGFKKGKLNPLVVEAMKEIDFDISNNQTKSVFKLFKQGRIYHYVITVCDAANAERCPLFPGMTKRLNWSFEDPASFTGTDEEKLEKIRLVRDSIKIEVNRFVKNINLLT